MDLSVIIPVYNEKNTIDEVISRVKATGFANEIVLVDDGSTDGSTEILKKYQGQEGIQVIICEQNRGKGAAVREGIKAAKSTYAIIQDADFEYDPKDYAKLMPVIESGQADVVYGSRFMSTPGQVRYFKHEMGNKLLTFCSNWFSDIHLSDMETCYKAFKREVVQNLKLTSQRFGIEPEMTAKLARHRALRIWEVPISYCPRRFDEGKKIGWKDGVAAFWHIFRFNCLTKKTACCIKPWEEVLKDD